MDEKELTPRQTREHEAYEAEKVASRHNALMDATYKPPKQGLTAFDRRNYLRKKAGWPPLKEKING